MKFPVTYDFLAEDTPKAQALKVLEEAAEFVEATKWDPSGAPSLEEAMDVLQALANYCEMYFTEQQLQDGYERVFTKNFERGYYDCHIGGGLYDNAADAYRSLKC